MNKQELIDKWENKTGAPTFETRGVTERASNDDMYTFGYGVARKEILEDLKQLDEHPKHVMPKFFDEWAKQVVEKHDKFYAISLVARAGWGYGVDFELSENGSSSENKELLYWLVDKCSDNYPNKTKAVEALLNGYEVEKEPLYHVKLTIPGATYYLIQTFLMPGYTHMCFSAATERYGAKWKNTFTESEIKSIDERYWAFAVPVEEVAEG